MTTSAPIEVRPVRGWRERRIFLTFPWRIYRGDPLWVPPLLPERAKVIDPEQGAFFKRGEAEFYVAWRGREPVGTICAAEDFHTNDFMKQKNCVFGFFEYLPDYEVFEALLHQAQQWGQARGLNALFGPFNLDYEDSYGVLIEGRDRPPVMLCGHTPPYYLDYMLRFGFVPPRADNIAFAVDITHDDPARQKLSRIADRVRARKQFAIRTANLDNWDAEVENVFYLINRALAHLEGNMSWQRDALEGLLEPFRKLADPELILFADADGKSVGFFPGVGDINEVLQHVNGLRYPWDYLRLLWHMRTQPECLSIKSVLVLPEYWNTGIAVLLFDEMIKRATARGFKWLDLSITSADNPATPVLAERLGGTVYKRWRVYRYEF
jgi:GNAT superfamily N-acetyltransferase